MQKFRNVITTEGELREVIKPPHPSMANKSITYIDEHCRRVIAASPFLILASRSPSGFLDVSPKGDPAGFVQVLDEHTLAIPDRPGNNRADTFGNILVDPNVGLLFLVPGVGMTLRITGKAKIVRDAWLLEQLAHNGKPAQLAMVVAVERVMAHCTKCMVRSHLWQPDNWPDISDVPSLGAIMATHAQIQLAVEQLDAIVTQDIVDNLY